MVNQNPQVKMFFVQLNENNLFFTESVESKVHLPICPDAARIHSAGHFALPCMFGPITRLSCHLDSWEENGNASQEMETSQDIQTRGKLGDGALKIKWTGDTMSVFIHALGWVGGSIFIRVDLRSRSN